MAHRYLATPMTIAVLALFHVAVPQPIVLDMLAAGLVSLGLGMVCQSVCALSR